MIGNFACSWFYCIVPSRRHFSPKVIFKSAEGRCWSFLLQFLFGVKFAKKGCFHFRFFIRQEPLLPYTHTHTHTKWSAYDSLASRLKVLWIGKNTISNWNHHHHHHVALSAKISLTLSRHPSLSSIASGRSSGMPFRWNTPYVFICTFKNVLGPCKPN